MSTKEHARRNQLARERGFRNYYEMRKLGGATALTRQSESVVASLPGEAVEVRQAALEAVSLMRKEGVTLQQAAGRAGVPAEAVKFWAGDALEAGEVKAADRLLRNLWIVAEGGVRKVAVRGSRQASLVSAHWQAVAHFLITADPGPLEAFRGRSVAGHRLETDPDVLEELALAGPLQFEDIYALAG